MVTDSLRHAMAPVLVSARLTGRNVFAGETFTVPVSIVNDAEDGRALTGGTLNWSFEIDGKSLSKGAAATPAVAYYTNEKVNLQLTAPANVPRGRADAQLCFELVVGGNVISSNHYACRIGEKAWALQPVKSAKGRVWACNASDDTRKLFQTLELKTAGIDHLKDLKLGHNDRLVIDGELSEGCCRCAASGSLRAGKGQVLWMRPQGQAKAVFPDQILNYLAQNGEVVTMLESESPVFDGIRDRRHGLDGRAQGGASADLVAGRLPRGLEEPLADRAWRKR